MYVPLWYTLGHPDNPCGSAMDFYNSASHDDQHSYGGPVQLDANGLFVDVMLPMTTPTADPLITDTDDSVPGSTYRLCWSQNPANARRRKLQGWTPGSGDFIIVNDVIDVVSVFAIEHPRHNPCTHSVVLCFDR